MNIGYGYTSSVLAHKIDIHTFIIKVYTLYEFEINWGVIQILKYSCDTRKKKVKSKKKIKITSRRFIVEQKDDSINKTQNRISKKRRKKIEREI